MKFQKFVIILFFIKKYLFANQNYNLMVATNTSTVALIKNIAGFKTAICIQKDLCNNNISGLAITKSLGKISLYCNTYNKHKRKQAIELSSLYIMNQNLNLFYNIQHNYIDKQEYGVKFIPISNFQFTFKIHQYNNQINNDMMLDVTYKIYFNKKQEEKLINLLNRDSNIFKAGDDSYQIALMNHEITTNLVAEMKFNSSLNFLREELNQVQQNIDNLQKEILVEKKNCANLQTMKETIIFLKQKNIMLFKQNTTEFDENEKKIDTKIQESHNQISLFESMVKSYNQDKEKFDDEFKNTSNKIAFVKEGMKNLESLYGKEVFDDLKHKILSESLQELKL